MPPACAARRGRRRRIEAAAEELAPYLAGRRGASAAVAAAVRSWGRSAVSTVLRRARRSLAGESELAISALLEELGETATAGARRPRGGALRRGRALRHLAGCGGPRARRELLRATSDRRPHIRRIAREGLLELRDPFSVRAAMDAFLGEPDLPPSWSRAFFLRLAVYAPGELRRLAADRRLAPDLEKLALEALAETGDAGRGAAGAGRGPLAGGRDAGGWGASSGRHRRPPLDAARSPASSKTPSGSCERRRPAPWVVWDAIHAPSRRSARP